MELIAFGSFAALVITWIVLPMRPATSETGAAVSAGEPALERAAA